MSAIQPLNFESYLALVKNSVGAQNFRQLYALVDGEKKEILENGNLACAYFVSSVLVIFKWLTEMHATVEGTVRDLEKNGWQKITEPKIGAVLVWAKNENGHGHIGFFLGEDFAVSNNSETGQIIAHHYTYGEMSGQPQRRLEAIYWNPQFGV